MYLEVITPETKAYEGEILGIKLPGIDGSFEMLNHHAPLISALGNGQLRIRDTKKQDTVMEIEGGIVEMKHNKVTVLAEKIIGSSKKG